MTAMPMGPTATLAAFAAGLDPAAVPPSAMHAAKRLIIDWLGCRAGGSRSEAGRLAAAWAGTATGAAGAAGTRASSRDGRRMGRPDAPLFAAYLDARLAAVLDADETYPGARQTSHLAAATVAAALGGGASRSRSGAAFLAAVIAGYEVGARISDGMVPAATPASRTLRAGWGPGSVLGATAAAGRAMDLDARRLAHAFGIAGTHIDAAPIQWPVVRPAPMAKSADAGWHAVTAVAAVQQAAIGLTGYDAILDGSDGLWRALGYEASDDAALVAGLGTRWIIEEAALKRWPCQYWMQPALTALAQVLDRSRVEPAALERIVLATNDKSRSAKFRDPDPPGEIDRAFSFPHAAAMLAVGIRPGPGWSDDAVAERRDVRRIRALVSVERHPEADAIDDWVVDHRYRELPASAAVTASGATTTAEVRAGLGSPWTPETRLTDAVLIEKALDMARWPDDHGPAVAALRGAIDWVLEAETRLDTAELIRLLDVDSANASETT
jgi:2-methylcitrate dehydratase PrpD